MQPLNTRQWTKHNIEAIKQALPKGVAFGTLSTPLGRSFELELETPVSARRVDEIVEQTEDALGDLGLPVEDIIVNSGYSGAMNPSVTLTVQMDA